MKHLLYLLFIAIGLPAMAQPSGTPDRKSISDTCDKVMKFIQSGNYMEGMLLVKRNSIMKEDALNELASKMDEQLKAVSSVYGNAIGVSFVKDKNISDVLFKRLYLLRLEQYYLKFGFTVYRGSKGWIMTGIIYNEDIEELY